MMKWGRHHCDREFGMRNMLITRLLAGFVLGIIIGLLFWIFNKRSFNDTELLFQLLASALFGMISMGGSVVYRIENWGLRKSTLFHYLVSLGAFILFSLIMGWFEGSVLFVAVIAYTVVYAVIWITMSLYWKRTVNELNDELKSLPWDKR